MRAIIRALGSGEHYLAVIGEDGTVEAMSDRLPIAGAKDPETGEPTDWEEYACDPVECWDDPADAWDRTAYAIVHRYDERNQPIPPGDRSNDRVL